MITVVFSTLNGGAHLSETLDSFTRLVPPHDGWKLVGVDNGSTDRTYAVLNSYCNVLPLTVLSEPRRGKNIALNRALSLLDGDLVVFTDDDIIPATDWLVAMRAAADCHPDVTVFGGAILPRWEVPPPDWLTVMPLGPLYALTEPGLAAGPMSPAFVYGPNMAVRASVFRGGQRFAEDIGPDGTDSYPMGSETEFTMRLASLGHRCWHVADAVVQHRIRAANLDLSWIYRRAYRFGRGERLKAERFGQRGRRVCGYPCWMVRRLVEQAVLSALPFCSPIDRMRSRWDVHCMLGALSILPSDARILASASGDWQRR